MKHTALYIFIFILIHPINVYSINHRDELSNITLGVYIPTSASKECIQEKDFIHKKLTTLATKTGYSSFNNTNFIIVPDIIINSIDVAEGGMKNVYVVQGDFSVHISDYKNETVFESILLPFKSYGTSLNRAIKNGIQNINSKDIETILISARQKILDYYLTREELIFSTIDTYVFNEEYEAAISILMSIPKELLELKKRAEIKAIEVYTKRNEAIKLQNEERIYSENEGLLSSVKSYIAMHKPIEALLLLQDFQHHSSQEDEYNKLLSTAEAMISEEEKAKKLQIEREYIDKKNREDREWNLHYQKENHRMSMEQQDINFRTNQENHKYDLENKRINTDMEIYNEIEDIAINYLQTHPDFKTFK